MRSSCAFRWLCPSLSLKFLEMNQVALWTFAVTTQKNSRLLFSLEPRSVETPTRPTRVYFLSWWIFSLVYRHRSGSNWS